MKIKPLAHRMIESVLGLYTPLLCRWEYRRQKHTKFNERPVEFGFVFKHIGQLYPLHILDVGTGKTALPHLMRNCGAVVTAIDNIKDYWQTGMRNRHYHIIDDDICSPKIDKKFDLITCISVLEHIEEYSKAIASMFKLLNDHGHLIITCPYAENSYVSNVYKLENSSYGQNAKFVTQSYSREQLNKWLDDNGGEIVDQEYWQYWSGDHWTVGNQIIPPNKVTSDEKHQLTCILIRKLPKNRQ